MLDKSRALPNLAPGDPRNLLSRAARLRIDDAYFQQQAIRNEADARIVAAYGLLEKNWAPAAWTQLSEAKMAAAFTVLSVVVQELMGVGKQGAELWDIVRDELEGAANSLQLGELERRAVYSRLWCVRVDPQKQETKPADQIDAARAKARNQWLDGKLAGEHSDVDLGGTGNISFKTIKKYRTGTPVSPKTLRGLSLALKALGISCEFVDVCK